MNDVSVPPTKETTGSVAWIIITLILLLAAIVAAIIYLPSLYRDDNTIQATPTAETGVIPASLSPNPSPS